MRHKAMLWIFALFLTAIAISSNVHALGITPGRTVIGFEPGRTKTITFTILNNENKDMKVLIYSDDQNAKFLDLKPAIVQLKADEPSKDFTFSIKVTGDALKPGSNEIKVKVKELPANFGEEDMAKVSASMELIHQLRINVPYTGKYAEADIYITSSDAEKPILFTIPVFNKGKEKIQSAKALIEIYDVNGKLAAAVETNEISLEPGKEGKVTAEVLTRLGRGRYKAVVHLTYDGIKIDMEKEFFVSVPLINIKAVTVDSNFRLGGIAKFALLLENMWNQKIEDVYSDITIKDESNKEMARFKTATTDIDQNSIAMQDAYWDTKDINPGLYRMSVIVNYLNMVNEKAFDMDVGFESISIREYGATGAVVAAKGAGLDKNILLGSAAFMLIVINIAVILYFKIYFKKRLKRPDKTDKRQYIEKFK